MRYRLLIPELKYGEQKPHSTSDNKEELINKAIRMAKIINTNIFVKDIFLKRFKGLIYAVLTREHIRKIKRRIK